MCSTLVGLIRDGLESDIEGCSRGLNWVTSHDLLEGNEESQAARQSGQSAVAKVKLELGTLLLRVHRVTATSRCSITQHGRL